MTVQQQPLFTASSNWPVSQQADVVVVGAGPAGFAAAVAAARLGVSVILLDSTAAPGGLATNAMIPHIMGIGMGGTQICAGLAEELIRRLGAMGHAFRRVAGRKPEDAPLSATGPLSDNIIASVHGLQLAMLRMLSEAKVQTRFYTSVIGAVVEERQVRAVAVDCAEGLSLICGKVFVDATGDAHLVHRAGGKTVSAANDEVMTKTLMMDVGGVENFDATLVEQTFRKLAEEKKIPVVIQDKFMGYQTHEPGILQLNFTATAGDGLDSRDLTRMDHELREQIETGVAWFRQSIPGFEHCYLLRTPSRVGVRAGRCGTGRETITQQDIDDNTPVTEPVAIGIRRYGDHGTKTFSAAWAKPVSGVRPIPWQTLLQADLSNVALAGRAISCEPKMQTCIRYMGQCFSTGQAAGVTTALAVKQNAVDLIDVRYDSVRSHLLAQNAILGVPC